MLLLLLTNARFATLILSSIERPPGPKKSLQSLKMSSWVYLRGRSVRYAKPVVEKTESRRDESVVISSMVEDSEESAERDIMGRDENDVDIL